MQAKHEVCITNEGTNKAQRSFDLLVRAAKPSETRVVH